MTLLLNLAILVLAFNVAFGAIPDEYSIFVHNTNHCCVCEEPCKCETVNQEVYLATNATANADLSVATLAFMNLQVQSMVASVAAAASETIIKAKEATVSKATAIAKLNTAISITSSAFTSDCDIVVLLKAWSGVKKIMKYTNKLAAKVVLIAKASSTVSQSALTASTLFTNATISTRHAYAESAIASAEAKAVVNASVVVDCNGAHVHSNSSVHAMAEAESVLISSLEVISQIQSRIRTMVTAANLAKTVILQQMKTVTKAKSKIFKTLKSVQETVIQCGVQID